MPTIKVLNISLVLLCIFITAFVCTFLAITSSEKALDDTKESRDVSVASCFAVGGESVTNRTTEYLDVVLGRTVDFLTQLTQQHRMAAEMIAKELASEPWDTVKQWDYHHISRYFHMFNELRAVGSTNIAFILRNKLCLFFTESRFTVERPPDEYHSLITYYNHGDDHPWGGEGRTIRASADSRGRPVGVTDPTTDVNWTRPLEQCFFALDTDGAVPDLACNATEWINPPMHPLALASRFTPRMHAMWTPPLPVEDYLLTLMATTGVYHDGAWSGAVAASIDLRQFSIYLAALEIGGHVAGHPSRGRVYISMRGTWLASMSRGSEMLAASHGSVVGRGDGNVLYPLRPAESADPIIRSVANRTADLDLDALASSRNLTVLNIETDLAPQGEDFYYRVGQLADSHGMDWYVHLGIDREYILGSIDKRTAETRDGIKASEDKVNDDLRASQTILYVTVVGVAVSLTMLSAVFVQVLLRPLSGLMEEMVWVSEMDLDRAGLVELSAMEEVREMQVAFRKMKQNLQDYKAYVPVALLNSSNELVVVKPPSGDVAMVFTDIVKSTELWARSSSGMNTALETHNEIIREAAADHSGYEVKTIGDSFMVAFDSPHDALAFSLQVLTGLVSSEWPEDLGFGSHGMRVRIGCHVGHTIPEENPLTGRRDYRGSAVNLASRSEGRALPGTVCVTSEFLKIAREGSKFSELGSPKIEDMGMQELKGIDGGRHMYLVSPTQSETSGRQMAYEEASCTSPMSASSTSGPVSLPHTSFSVQNKKTGLTLVKGNATVAVCMMVGARKEGVMFDDCNAMVRAAVEAASQTDGVVGNVTGQTLTVVWNGLKQCKLHTTSAMRFAAQLEVRAATVRVGLATGPLLYGNVGTQKRRFNTAFGRPLDAAHAGAALAAHCSTFALLVDLTVGMEASASAAVAPFVRLLDVWEEEGSGKPMTLYELLSKKLMHQLENAWGTVTADDADLEVYNNTFREAMKGESAAVEKLRLLAAMDPSDLVRKGVVAKLSKLSCDRSRTCRVQVRFSSIPAGVVDDGDEKCSGRLSRGVQAV